MTYKTYINMMLFTYLMYALMSSLNVRDR